MCWNVYSKRPFAKYSYTISFKNVQRKKPNTSDEVKAKETSKSSHCVEQVRSDWSEKNDAIFIIVFITSSE